MSRVDLDRWRRTAEGCYMGWPERVERMARYIRPGEVVCDLGAGAQTLRALLPEGCAYIPVDCVDVLPGTFVVDFNRECRFPPASDVYFAAGFFEYVDDVPEFLRKLRVHAPGKRLLFSRILNAYGVTFTFESGEALLDSLFRPFLGKVTYLDEVSAHVIAEGTL